MEVEALRNSLSIDLWNEANGEDDWIERLIRRHTFFFLVCSCFIPSPTQEEEGGRGGRIGVASIPLASHRSFLCSFIETSFRHHHRLSSWPPWRTRSSSFGTTRRDRRPVSLLLVGSFPRHSPDTRTHLHALSLSLSLSLWWLFFTFPLPVQSSLLGANFQVGHLGREYRGL